MLLIKFLAARRSDLSKSGFARRRWARFSLAIPKFVQDDQAHWVTNTLADTNTRPEAIVGDAE